MDEFVKRLYDFMGIYRIFWSQNSHYRYLPIFTDIFSEIPVQARVLHSRDFSVEKSVILPIFPLINFFSTFFSRCRSKTDFSEIYRLKKMIFYSLIIIDY